MQLAEKLSHLRGVEGQLRGLGRPLSKAELSRLMRAEVGEALSLPYLSQIENGTRPHLTTRSRNLVARFFRIHPGYLVSDPEGFAEGLVFVLRSDPEDIAEWLAQRAQDQRRDPDLFEALLRLAAQPDPRAAIIEAAQALPLSRTAADSSIDTLATAVREEAAS